MLFNENVIDVEATSENNEEECGITWRGVLFKAVAISGLIGAVLGSATGKKKGYQNGYNEGYNKGTNDTFNRLDKIGQLTQAIKKSNNEDDE